MSTGFTPEQRELQDRFDTRRLADRIEERIVHETIDERDRAFIEARDMFFLATADADGSPLRPGRASRRLPDTSRARP